MSTIKSTRVPHDDDELSRWLGTVVAIVKDYGDAALDRRWRKAYTASGSFFLAAIAISLSLGCESSIATETPDTAVISFDASVQMTGTTVAAGIGYGWGHGTITYHGTEHAFCVHGVSVGDVGIAHIHAEGLVFHMNHLHDFPGRYYAGSIGVAVIGGESTVLLKNRNGVTLQLESKENGLRFNISASGLRIAMARNGHCGN